MAGSTVTSTLDIRLIDDVSPNAEKVGAALKKVEAEAKAIDGVLAKSGAGEKFGASLKNVGASVTHVEAAAKAWKDYAAANGLAADRSSWTSKDLASVKAWERTTVAGVRAVIAAEKDLKAERDRASADRRRQVLADHRAQERLIEQAHHGAAHHGIANYALTTAAMAVSAHGIMSVVEKVYEHGAEYQHRLVALQNAGRTPEEIASMQAASHATIAAAPTATLSENLEILNETVGAFGSVEHALEHLTFMNKAAATLHAVAGDKISDSAGQMGNKLARFFEMRGTAGNGEVFEREASEMIKSMVFSGGNVNPSELLNFAQQAKSALQNYDLHFLSRVAPSLIGEVGGDRAGTQANAFNSVLLGKVNDKKQAEAWLKYKLVDPKQMTMSKGHAVGWTGGAVYHTDEFLKDPFAAGEKYVLPALAAAGVDINNQLELTKALGTLYRNQNANAFANELWQRQNRQRLHKDDALIGQVEDVQAIYKRLLATDPPFALKALGHSLENLMTTVSAPAMETTARMFSGFAAGLNDLAVAAHDHPAVALTAGLATAAGALYAAGRLSYGLMNGFGGLASIGPAAVALDGSAVALDGSAGAITAAAGRLGLSGIAHDIPGGVPVGKVAGKVEGAVVREGEHIAEDAAEMAIGGKIVGAVEGALKGGLSVGAMEIAAAAGVTLTAGTVALVGLSAAAILAALHASTPPKHHASDDPGFGNPFASGKGIDFNDPQYRVKTPEEEADAAKPWQDRNAGAHPRGSLPHYRDTDQPGHWEKGPHGRMIWALEDHNPPPLKNAPYFSTAPLGPDGHPLGSMPNGWMGGRVPVDPSTGRIFGFGRMPTNPDAIDWPKLADRTPGNVEVPAPPTRPLPPNTARYPIVPEPTMVEPPPVPAPVPPPRMSQPQSDNGAPGRDPASLAPLPPAPVITPTVEPASAVDALFQLGSLATTTGNEMTAALNVSATATLNTASIDAGIAKAREFIAVMQQAASVASSAGGGVPGAGAIRAASNRQFAGASQTG